MAQYKNMFNVDLSGQNSPVMLRQMIAEGNVYANRVGAIVSENGQAVQLGGSCSGKVIRADGVTVLLTGVVDGSSAYVVLDGESYAVPGNIEITVTWTSGSNVTTLLKAYGTVERTQTSEIIPSNTPLNIDEILALLEGFASGEYFKADSTIIVGNGTLSEIADHDDVLPNVLYRLQVTTKMSWLPSAYPTDGSIYYLIDITHKFGSSTGVAEIIFDYTMQPKWIRQKQPSASWGSWSVVPSEAQQLFALAFKSDTTIITGDGTASEIANHNNVKENTLYRLQLTTKMSWLPSNYPTDGSVYYLIDITHHFTNNTVGIAEMIFDYTMQPKWIRQAQPGSSFGSWAAVDNGVEALTKVVFRSDSMIITGDGTVSAIADHSNVVPNMLYRFQLTTKMSWLPSDYPTDGSIMYFMSITMPFTLGRTSVTEVLFNEKMIVQYVRNRQPDSTSFDSWSKYIENIHTDSTIITGDGTSSAIANHDKVNANTLYRLQLTTKMSWLPSDYPTDASIMYLMDITIPFGVNIGIAEIVFDYMMRPRWIRQAQPSQSFGGWEKIDYAFEVDSTIITGDGTSSAIANHDKVRANMLYRLQLTTKCSWMPTDYVANGSVHFLLDVTHHFGSYVGVVELILDEHFRIKWARSAQPNGSFGSWYAEKDGRLVITLSPGTNTIQNAVALAVYLGNADVILLPGSHIISTFDGNGMSIGNNVRVIGTPDAIIQADSAEGNQYFSPFYAGTGDFELIGVNITCSNVRYCVHDDPPSASASTPARHVYRDCSFYIDNTENSLWPNHQCIGGGMGMHTTIEVENCYFEAADPDYNLGLLSYHNNGNADAQGLIFVKDSEFAGANGTVRFGWYGASTLITKCYVVGCKMGHAPVIRAETEQSTNENMTLIQWGNVIGSSTLTVYKYETTHTLAASTDYLNIGNIAGKTLINVYLIGWDSDALMIKGFVDNGAGYSIFFNKSLTNSKSITLRRIYANG